jgi:hypothetical protein
VSAPVNVSFTSTVSLPGALLALRTEFNTMPNRVRGDQPLKAIPSPPTTMTADAETTILALRFTNGPCVSQIGCAEMSGKKYHSGRSIC